MRRKVVYTVMALSLAIILLSCFLLFVAEGSSNIAHAQVPSLFLAPTPTPPKAGDGIDWGNPTIIGALIALIGVFATAGVYVYQTRRNAKLEHDKLESQHEHDQ
jgi:divalent metal cation (Fe/Co/Zn/Cd) transporter